MYTYQLTELWSQRIKQVAQADAQTLINEYGAEKAATKKATMDWEATVNRVLLPHNNVGALGEGELKEFYIVYMTEFEKCINWQGETRVPANSLV